MKKLGRMQTFAVAGLSALALAVPVAMAQTAGGDQGQQKQEGARGGRRGKGEFGGRHDKGGRRGGHFGGGAFRGVELTDEQKTRMQQLRQGFGERTKSLREQLRAKRQELRQAESGSTFNEALAQQKLTESAALQARLMGEEFRLRQESLAILTPEQRTQLEQRRQQREQRRAQRNSRRGAQPGTQLQ
ncbi:MAG TPA: Spy/CpxP family protein refolding chaperone [Pyrinomonadaceae bacterium]|jgi:protein CpxP